jgi:Kdo2-lipid IVA lauroyltransferase/acyltransferase
MLLLRLLSLLPLPVLYVLCGGLAWAARIAGWRMRLVMDGLSLCLPACGPDELRRHARDFYAGLGRLVAEFVYEARMTPAEFEERLRFEDDAVVRDALAAGRRVLLVAGHHCNWEWLHLEISRRFGETGVVAPYKPLSRDTAERWVLALRTRFGATMVPAQEVGPFLVARRRQVRLIAMLADQSPSAASENQVWLPFFGRDTSFFQGPGWIGEKLRFEPVFVAMMPVGRGRYVARFVPLAAPGERLDSGQILRAYVRELEKQILRYPAHYFWAYNRWKRAKPQDEPARH